MGETGPHGLDDLLTSLPRCCRGGVDDDVGEFPAPGLALVEHLDELVVDGPQGHRPGRIKSIAGGQHASGTGQGHGVVTGPQAFQPIAQPRILQASRAQRHDGALGLCTVEEIEGDTGLDPAVLALRHCNERQVGAGCELVGNAAAQVEHGQALSGPDGTPHAGASGPRRTDDDQGPRRVSAQAPCPPTGSA